MLLTACSVTLDESLLEHTDGGSEAAAPITSGDEDAISHPGQDSAAPANDAAAPTDDASTGDDTSDAGGGGFDASVDAPATDSATASPAPTLASVSPSSLVALSNDTTVTLTGTGFVASSIAQIGGVAVATTYVSDTQLGAIVPKAALALPGTLAFTVATAPPGGGVSAAINVGVACDATGVDVGLTTLGQAIAKPTSLNTQLNSYRDNQTCPAAMYANITEASHGYIVQNQTAATAALSTWAVCDSSNNDAFLTFYRRATVPQTSNEISACTGAIAEGKSGRGALASPESGPSSWCPGLTKSNGAALSIAACEKVVVFMQEYDVGLGPSNMKVQIDAP